MGILIGKDDWEVCAHTHTPNGIKPDLESAEHWNWSPAQLPFDAIGWLWKSGRGPDPMVQRNDLHYRWVEDVDWVLRKSFVVSPETFGQDDEIQLALDGLDCYCEVYLNGQHLGRTRNQFREHAFDLDELRTDSPNELLLYIRSAKNVNNVLESAYGQLPAGFDAGRVHARRCQSVTGWDWTPRLSSVALLHEPELRTNIPVSIAHPHVYVAHLSAVSPGQETAADVSLHLEVDLSSRRRASGDLVWEVFDCETGELVAEKVESLVIKPKTLRVKSVLTLPEAKLWWSLGMGGQARYRATARLETTDRLGVSYLSEVECGFGVRTLTVDRRKDEQGESFVPTLNGVPVFCRGANWVPVHVLPSEVRESDYRELLAAAIGAGINCLRVWGGGVYEQDVFYDLCDQAGILVWQDFMFACAAYPVYREFVEEVEAEAVYQVQRLRNHPSLMLWCGNSENEWLHQAGNLRKGNEQRVIGETIWSHVLKEVVEDQDALHAYHQSSPFGKNRLDYNDAASGDRHMWEVWADWLPANAYLMDNSRFISEFGVQALSSESSVTQVAPDAAGLYDSDLSHHQRMPEGTERLVRYVAAHHALPTSLSGWIETSQEVQALLLGRAVEHWRRRRFHTAGCLIWQFNEGYPAITWSLIDFYRRPKTALVAAQRFFAPVLLSAELLLGEQPVGAFESEVWQAMDESGPTCAVEGDPGIQCAPVAQLVQCRFHVINDTHLPLSGAIRARFMQGSEEVEALPTVHVTLEPNGAHAGLTHVLDQSLLAILPSVTVEAEFVLNEESRAAFDRFAGEYRARQQEIAGEAAPLLPADLDAGLKVSTVLVEPKYFQRQETALV